MPGYGQKGMGVIKDPKKATYNAIYNSTTKSVFSTPKQPKTAKAKESTARLLDLYPYDKKMPIHLKIIITAINAGKIVLALACIAGVIYTIWLFIWLMFINR